MTEAAQDTFERYAYRVKEIFQHSRCRVDSRLLSSISSFSPGTSFLVLSNLITASLSIIAISDSTCCLPVSPSLQHLHIRTESSGESSFTKETLHRYLSAVQAAASDLRSVHLRGWLCQQTNEVVASMSSLKSASFRTGRSLTASTFSAMTGFPTLRVLTIRADHLALTDISPSEGPAKHLFPALEELTIHAQEAVVSHVLSHLRPASLHSLCIELTSDSSANTKQRPSWDDMIRSIAVIASPHLHTLRIEHYAPFSEQLDPTLSSDHVNLALLKPLVAFGRLIDLSLHLGLPVALTDADITTLAPEWPALRRLRLETPAAFFEGELGWSWRTPATPRCLASLATSMPALEELELALDISNHALLGARTVASTGQASMRFVHLASGAECTDPKSLAEFLHAQFPALQDVLFDERHQEAWRAVEDAFYAIKQDSV
jgi:hypothetical protein